MCWTLGICPRYTPVRTTFKRFRTVSTPPLKTSLERSGRAGEVCLVSLLKRCHPSLSSPSRKTGTKKTPAQKSVKRFVCGVDVHGTGTRKLIGLNPTNGRSGGSLSIWTRGMTRCTSLCSWTAEVGGTTGLTQTLKVVTYPEGRYTSTTRSL